MRLLHSRLKRWTQLFASATAGIALIAAEPGLANASLMTNYWTSTENSGFIAFTASSPANLEIESDVTFNNNIPADWYGGYLTNTTYIEVNTHIAGCSNGGNGYTIYTQHRASNPSTNEYEFQTSGGSGTCGGGGGGGWDPEGEHCRLNASLAAQGNFPKDPACP